METGILAETKHKKTRTATNVKTWVFATSNNAEKIAEAAAEAVWNKMKSANVRDCVKIGRMAKSIEDVNFIVDAFQ